MPSLSEYCCGCCKGKGPDLRIDYKDLKADRLYDIWLLYDAESDENRLEEFVKGGKNRHVANFMEWVEKKHTDEIDKHLKRTNVNDVSKRQRHYIATECYLQPPPNPQKKAALLQIRDVGQVNSDLEKKVKTLKKMGEPDCLVFVFDGRTAKTREQLDNTIENSKKYLRELKLENSADVQSAIIIVNSNERGQQTENLLNEMFTNTPVVEQPHVIAWNFIRVDKWPIHLLFNSEDERHFFTILDNIIRRLDVRQEQVPKEAIKHKEVQKYQEIKLAQSNVEN